MRYVLEGVYTLSKPVEGQEEQVRGLLRQCEERVTAKRVRDYTYTCDASFEGEEMSLKIAAENISAHELFYRFKKCFTEELGKNLRIKVKQTRIGRYEITFSVPREPLAPLRIPFVSSISFSGNRCTILLENLDEKFITRNWIERIIRRIREKVERQYYAGKEEFWELMEQTPPREPVWRKDPVEEMVQRKWLKQGPTKGKWFYRPQAAAILNAMREIAIKEILQPLGFQEVIESNFVPFDIWLRTGHLVGVPNEIYYYSEPVSRDPALWEEVEDLIYITREVPADKLRELVSAPRGGFIYAQCPVIYWSFRNAVIPNEDLPLKIYENTVISARYESGGRHGIERTDEFHRIEVVFIGTKDQLVELREQLIDRYRHIFNDIFGIEWRMAWVTPWYMQQAGQAGVEEATRKLVGTIDFEAYLPYRGSREEKDSWLEFQNLTIAGDKFTGAFNIKAQKGELWSGCSGIGLERWTVVFLSQNGLDPDKWPKPFRRYLSKLPKGFRFL